MRILRLAFAFALAVAPTLATAQQFPTIPSDTVIGRTQFGSGPAQAIPFSQLIALMLQQSALTIPNITTNSVVFKGSSSGQATLEAQAVAGTPTLSLPNTTGTLASNATSPIVLDPATGNISCPTCATSTGASQPVIASRAVAQTLNLSGLSALHTLGYSQPGDGGSGTFVKITGNFRDSYTTGASVTSNGGTCTNGSYLGNFFTGGNGANFQGNITVSGGNASLTNILDYGGNGYSVGDVLTVNSAIGGCSPQVTISAVSTALASFTDSVGNKWQYTPSNGFINPLAFGCKFDWSHANGDSAATDDTACVRDVMAFAAYASPNNINWTDQSFASNRILFPPGTSILKTTDTAPGSLLGKGIIQPIGVIAEGAGATNTIFKVPDAGIVNNFWNLCDVNKHLACFGTVARDFGITATTSATFTSAVYLLYSNSDQQLQTVQNMQIYDGSYGCYRYDNGYGGAATTTYINFFCTHQNSNMDGIVIDSSTTVFRFDTLIVEGASTQNAFDLLNGHVDVEGGHSEGIANIFNVNGPASSSSLTVAHFTGGSGCTNFATLQSTNSPGNFALFDAYKNGCSTNLVLDGQSGGSNRTADAIPANGWVSFNP